VTLLGSGFDSGFPAEIDTRQIFENVPSPAPDSNTRVDKEVINDGLSAIVNIETCLGTNPQGPFGSVAARLNFHFPEDVVATPSQVISFTSETEVIVPASQHLLTSPQILWRVYNAGSPRAAIEPGSFSVDPITLQVVLQFGVPQSGTLLLDTPPARYETTFINASAFTVLGTTHGLGTADLFYQLYDAGSPNMAMEPESVTVHPTTRDVIVRFQPGMLHSGRFVLSPGRLTYAQSFTNQTNLTILGTTHGLSTPALLYQVYDAATPRNAIAPGSFVVDPTTFNVGLGFAVPQSGRVLLTTMQPPASLLAVRTPARRVGPIDPVPVLMRTVQALAARVLALEEAHSALQAHLAAATTEDPHPC
jgi:hypothetical protein